MISFWAFCASLRTSSGTGDWLFSVGSRNIAISLGPFTWKEKYINIMTHNLLQPHADLSYQSYEFQYSYYLSFISRLQTFRNRIMEIYRELQRQYQWNRNDQKWKNLPLKSLTFNTLCWPIMESIFLVHGLTKQSHSVSSVT